MSDWYALRVTPRQEASVAAVLAERGITFFLPMETIWHGSPRVKHMAPLLAGYVFVLCDTGDFANLHGVEGVLNFVRYLREDGMTWPAPFPAREILGLQIEERRGLYDRTRNTKPPRYRPKKGERVQITAGTYLGFFATVLSAPTKDRRKLLIDGFGKARHKTLDVGHLVAA
jgi:transcription antitermination factor NusG